MVVRMGMGMDRPIGMSMLVGVAVRVNVLVGMLMFDVGGHGSGLLKRVSWAQ